MISNCIEELIKSDDPVLRNRAALALGKQGVSDDRTISALLSALKDPEWMVRGNAAKALARLEPQNQSIFEHVIALLNDDEESVIIEAFSALHIMADNGFSPSNDLIETMTLFYSSSNTTTRTGLIQVLSKFAACKKSFIDMIVMAVEDPCEEVRFWAIAAANECPEAAIRALPYLTKSMEDDSDYIKYASLSMIQSMGELAHSATISVKNLYKSKDCHLIFMAVLTISNIAKGILDTDILLKEYLISGNADERRLVAAAIAQS